MSEDQAWASDIMRAGHAIAYHPQAQVLHSHQYRIVDVFRRNFDSGYSIQQTFGGATGISTWSALAALAEEAAFVLWHGSMNDRLRFFPYELARHAGFLLGLNADRMPMTFNRACSGLRYFWDQRTY